MAEASTPLLSVEHLKVSYPIRSSILLRKIGEKLAVSDVNFEIRPGETVGLVGESGSGKSTIARTVIGLVPSAGGVIRFEGRDITKLTPRELKEVRRDMQMVFQDPYASLNPRLTVRDLIAEAWRVHTGIVPRDRWTAEAKDLMERVGLNPDYSDRYPHQFSGGQRQRIGIAYLFVAHDLAVVRHISHRVAVMYLGHIVEVADRDALFTAPRHPYTEILLSAVPAADPRRRSRRVLLAGDPPSPANPPPGCRVHTRCPLAQPICREQKPALMAKPGAAPAASPEEHLVACHFR
jgi:oligopeptide transport system ATP-binding protein